MANGRIQAVDFQALSDLIGSVLFGNQWKGRRWLRVDSEGQVPGFTKEDGGAHPIRLFKYRCDADRSCFGFGSLPERQGGQDRGGDHGGDEDLDIEIHHAHDNAGRDRPPEPSQKASRGRWFASQGLRLQDWGYCNIRGVSSHSDKSAKVHTPEYVTGTVPVLCRLLHEALAVP